MRRRDFLGHGAAAWAASPPRPNVVFILVDDLRFDELACTGHPFAQTPGADRLASERVSFRNAFASTPLDSPSRASFLTGTYAHTHGIVDNVARDALSHHLVTWPRLLHDAGYRTAFLGQWHMGNDDSPRPGFDPWVSFRGQGECENPDSKVDGRNVSWRGYVTDLLNRHALEFLDQPQKQPFCLYLAHQAIHPNVQQNDVQQNDDGSVNVASASARRSSSRPRATASSMQARRRRAAPTKINRRAANPRWSEPGRAARRVTN
jgi:arylsulfatase A-like enzyme